MQINLNKKEFYKKVVLYFKKELIGTQYKEHETDDCLYFAIERNCNRNSLSIWYYKKFDKIECQILKNSTLYNTVSFVNCSDIEEILYHLTVSIYVPFNINEFNILVKSELI